MMRLTIDHAGIRFKTDLANGIDISLPLSNYHRQVCAFHAPPVSLEPHTYGSKLISVRHGAPVNFYDVRINPHGNGTHTECVGHILPLNDNLLEEPYTINKCLQRYWFVARLITVQPVVKGNDRVISATQIESMDEDTLPAEALIIRTLPNPSKKRFQNYSGTNPPYFDPQAIAAIKLRGINHLLTDLPSVDPEEDGGKLLAHRMFWFDGDVMHAGRTITELIFVPDHVKDGYYLLNLQIIPLELDASPSKPVLYPVGEVTQEFSDSTP